ncbi:MAG: hypothetical protein JWQ20_3132 [Conexibacter sp.]|nr:hypothetical protein [Conexibacter sp.]
MTAVVLDALAGVRDPQLRDQLGAEADDRLQRALRDRAIAWARRARERDGVDAAPGVPLELTDAGELQAALAGYAGPVLLVAPDVPGLSEHHLAAARDDLQAGVLLSSAASGDGTPFLVVLARPAPELLAVVGAPFEEVAAAAVALGGELGMLRAERRLATLADARALHADPLAPAELRDVLGSLG